MARKRQSETRVRAGADSAREVEIETDAMLVGAVARGDAAAFRQLTDRYVVAVHRLAARMLGDSNEADEVAQDTFLKLWTRADRWSAENRQSTVLPWLRSLTMNACIDRLRRRRFHSAEEVPERADEGRSAFEEINQRRLATLVTGALRSLPDRQRAAIVLTYYEELPNADAAAAMDLNLKAFESLLLRARQAMKKTLAAMGIDACDLKGAA